jgi:hypothetical protein
MPNAQDVYMVNVRPLPPAERLRVAALILEEFTQAAPPVVEESAEWSEEDIRDLTAFSLQYAATLYPEEEEYA